jgi:peptide methionine sulfoxide reductase MsrA
VGDTDALTHIKEKNYHQKYLKQNREIYLVGINFDEDEKNISEFLWEKI